MNEKIKKMFINLIFYLNIDIMMNIFHYISYAIKDSLLINPSQMNRYYYYISNQMLSNNKLLYVFGFILSFDYLYK